MHAIKRAIESYLLLGLISLSTIAFFADRLLPVDIFVESKPVLPWLIVITMFAIGWTLPADEVRQVVSRWPTVLGGTTTQYVVMPLLAWALAKLFQLEGGLLIGMIMVGCVPGAMASNVLTLMARGSTSYSVCLTTAATLLSPIVVPMALRLTLGDTVDSQTFLDAAVELTWMVVLPVISGFALSLLMPQFKSTAGALGSVVANLTILWIIAYVVASNRSRLGAMEIRVIVALLLVNAGGYLAGWSGGKLMRLPTSMKRALSLEVGMQNAGLGTVLVGRLFPDDPTVLVPPALYTFVCMLTGTMLARLWHSIAIADDERVVEETG